MHHWRWILEKENELSSQSVPINAWGVPAVKNYSLFNWNSNLTGCPVFYLAVLTDSQDMRYAYVHITQEAGGFGVNLSVQEKIIEYNSGLQSL